MHEVFLWRKNDNTLIVKTHETILYRPNYFILKKIVDKMTRGFDWLVALLILLTTSSMVVIVNGQAEVIAVTSFRNCVSLDSSIGTVPGVGQTLDCTPDSSGQDPIVTTLDLRVVPGLQTNSEFNIDLTVVLNNQGGNSTSSPSSTTCDTPFPGTQLCVATDSATMKIRTSRPVFSYALTRSEQFSIPYCYASVAQFEQLSTDDGATNNPCHASSQISSPCGSTVPMRPSSHTMACTTMLQALTQNVQSRVQNYFPPTTDNYFIPGRTCLLTDPDTNPSETNYDDPIRFYFGNQNPNGGQPDGMYGQECLQGECQGNMYNTEQIPVSALAPTTTAPQLNSNYRCCSFSSPDGTAQCDSRNMDARIPAYKPQPGIFGNGPPNLWDLANNDVSEYIRNNTVVGKQIWDAQQAQMSAVGCASPRCPANRDSRRSVETPTGPDSGVPSSYEFSQHLIVPLGPQCSVFKVSADPKIIITVDIDVTVTTLNAQGDKVEKTETLSLETFSTGETQSSVNKLLRARFENIQSVDSTLGPSIEGYIVVCGRSTAALEPDFPDMRDLLPLDDDGKRRPITVNPWPYIKEQFEKDAPGVNRVNYYPLPFDYSPLGIRGKSDSGTGLNDDLSQTFWYFVPLGTAMREWGTGCNQVGIKAGWTSSQANQETMCRLPPHECVPGIGKFYSGGRKTSLPCTVSSQFAFLSGLLDLDEGTTGDFQSSNRYTSVTTDQMNVFMPGDEFDEDSSSGGGTQSTSALYNPQAPNFWLADGKLLYQPTGNQPLSSTVSAELVVDYLGTFVSYVQEVASARLTQLNELDCDVGQMGITTLNISVENLSQPGIGVATSYLVAMDCDLDSTGVAIISANPAIVGPIEPGATDTVIFTIQQDGSSAQKASCSVTLSSATDVVDEPIMDTATVNCNIAVPGPPIIYVPSNATAPAPQPETCEGFCPLDCLVLQGGLGTNACFIVIMSIVAVILAILVSLVILYIVSRYRSDVVSLSDLRKGKKELRSQHDGDFKSQSTTQREEIESTLGEIDKIQEQYGGGESTAKMISNPDAIVVG